MMFVFALDVIMPDLTDEVLRAVERDFNDAIIMLVILLCVSVGIVNGYILTHKKPAPPTKEEAAGEEEGQKDD